jgi:HAMP domain-containing protein
VRATGLQARAAALANKPAVRLLAVGAVLGTALAAVLVAMLGHRQASSAHLLGDPLVVNGALSTSAALFGDPLEADVDVYSNDRSIEAGSVTISTDFRPYRVAATRISRSSQGGVSLLRTRISLECLTHNCLPPKGGVRVITFPSATVSYRASGRGARALVPWEPLQLSSRLPLKTTPRVGIVDSAPPLQSRFERSPETLSALFLLVAAALGLVGAALFVTALWSRSFLSRRRRRPLSPLERSLQRVEAAAQSDEPTRRRTLDDLATHLGDVPAPALELQTRAIAWGQSPPDPEVLTLLAAQVRTALNGGVRA